MIPYEKFIKFLKKEKVHKKFFVNLLLLKSYLETLKPCYYLNAAFGWKETSEGFKFWSDLNEKWIEILNKEGFHSGNKDWQANLDDGKS